MILNLFGVLYCKNANSRLLTIAKSITSRKGFIQEWYARTRTPSRSTAREHKVGSPRAHSFGFNDGNGQNETGQVEGVLADAGYAVKMDAWGLHNEVIVSIKKHGQELIPFSDLKIAFGYTDPREYLPAEIIALLDQAFPEDE